jgi:hypothetical protein
MALIFCLLLVPPLAGDPAWATPKDIPIIITGQPAPPPPPPGCMLSLNPMVVTILSTAPKGTELSVIDAVSCTGAPAFGAPNFDDGGLFAISGQKIIINPQGPGVAALGNTTQSATITVAP